VIAGGGFLAARWSSGDRRVARCSRAPTILPLSGSRACRRDAATAAPDAVAVAPILAPIGDEVAPVTVTAAKLSASLTPQNSPVGGDVRRRLARCEEGILPDLFGQEHCCSYPEQPAHHALQGLVGPFYRSLLPQDRKNCHSGGNSFVSCNGFVPNSLCNPLLLKE
jgi:hypothetical protein